MLDSEHLDFLLRIARPQHQVIVKYRKVSRNTAASGSDGIDIGPQTAVGLQRTVVTIDQQDRGRCLDERMIS
jgi:hypothetical protein